MNAINFTESTGLNFFLNELFNKSETEGWLREKEIEESQKWSIPERCNKIGIVLRDKGYISNSKIIYELYRHFKKLESSNKEFKPKLVYFLDQCEKMFELCGAKKRDNYLYFRFNDGDIIIGFYVDIERKFSGRPLGKRNKKFTGDERGIISKFYTSKSSISWEEASSFIRKQLIKNSFSIYSYVEYKPLKNTLKEEKCTIEILRNYVEFNEETMSIYIADNLNIVKSYEVRYFLTPISSVKIAIKTNDILLDLIGDPQISFFFEIENYSFHDFAQGYFREVNLNSGFKVGTAILIKEVGSRLDEIKEMKVISYNQLSELPIEPLKNYFQQRCLNFLRPPVIKSQKFEELGQKLKLLKNRPKDIRMYKYDIFLSMPILFDNPSEKVYNERLSYYSTLEKQLTNYNIYFAAAKKSYQEYSIFIQNQSFEQVLEEIPNAPNYLLFIPPFKDNTFTNVSKAILELGAAKYLKRNILIIYFKGCENFLPNIDSIHVEKRTYNNLDDLTLLDLDFFLKT